MNDEIVKGEITIVWPDAGQPPRWSDVRYYDARTGEEVTTIVEAGLLTGTVDRILLSTLSIAVSEEEVEAAEKFPQQPNDALLYPAYYLVTEMAVSHSDNEKKEES